MIIEQLKHENAQLKGNVGMLKKNVNRFTILCIVNLEERVPTLLQLHELTF